MKRICCYCKKDMGEKCRKCGGVNVQPLSVDDNTVWNCRTCGNTWPEGSEPISHGICEPPCPEAIKAGIGRRSGSVTRLENRE